MSKHATLDEFTDAENGETEATVLFRYTADQFVNEAIAELARQLEVLGEEITVEPDRVVLQSGADIERVVDHIENIITGALANTHRRKAVAHAINASLEDVGYDHDDDRWIPPSPVPFPAKADTDVTVYPDSTVDEETLKQHGLSADTIDATISGETTLYRLSDEFVGNNQKRSFSSQRDRFERYFEAYRAALADEANPDDSACMSCGMTEMPAYKDADGDKLEYNQSFTVFASASGQATPLGARSRTTAHRGRCAACLVAGFYYTLIPKIVRPTATNENDTRVFAPVGNLEELVRIRADLDTLLTDVDEPTESGNARMQTLGTLYTDSFGIQTIEFYEIVLRHLNTEFSGDLLNREISYRPTGLASYISEVGRTRVIRAMETIDPESWAYAAVREQTTDQGDSYWPVSDVLGWFDHVEGDATRGLLEDKDNLAFGILNQDLARIERGVFQIAKTIDRNDGENVQYVPHKGYIDDYFQYIMSQSVTHFDSIDDDHIESIRRVASSLGQLFHGGDDIGMLIQLQNASTSTEFLQAFEKAAMQAQKKSVDEPPTRWQTSRDDDVETVLQLISNSDTFEPTKRMFVIHASLAAQHQNVQQADETADDGGDEA